MPHSITSDDFEAWRDHPVTKWVMAGLAAEAAGIREQWIAEAWDGGLLDPVQKERAFVRWDILDHVSQNLTFEEVNGYHGNEYPEA